MEDKKSNLTSPDFALRKKRILRSIAIITSAIGFALLFYTDWKIGTGIFFIAFAIHLRLNMQVEANKKGLLKIFEEILK